MAFNFHCLWSLLCQSVNVLRCCSASAYGLLLEETLMQLCEVVAPSALPHQHLVFIFSVLCSVEMNLAEVKPMQDWDFFWNTWELLKRHRRTRGLSGEYSIICGEFGCFVGLFLSLVSEFSWGGAVLSSCTWEAGCNTWSLWPLLLWPSLLQLKLEVAVFSGLLLDLE